MIKVLTLPGPQCRYDRNFTIRASNPAVVAHVCPSAQKWAQGFPASLGYGVSTSPTGPHTETLFQQK